MWKPDQLVEERPNSVQTTLWQTLILAVNIKLELSFLFVVSAEFLILTFTHTVKKTSIGKQQ